VTKTLNLSPHGLLCQHGLNNAARNVQYVPGSGGARFTTTSEERAWKAAEVFTMVPAVFRYRFVGTLDRVLAAMNTAEQAIRPQAARRRSGADRP
jgi:hypothetical protein